MYFPLIRNLFVKLASQGYTTLRFNFRGVGLSTGKGSWQGGAEQEDVIEVCNFLLGRPCSESNKNDADNLAQATSFHHMHAVKIKRIILVGMSYGAGIACAVADMMPEIAGMVSICYPLGPYFFLYFGNSKLWDAACRSHKPKLFIMGTEDNFTSVRRFESCFQQLSDPKTKQLVEGADHFWAGHGKELLHITFDWLQATFGDAHAGPRTEGSELRVLPEGPC